MDKKKPLLVGKEGKPSEVNHGNIAPSISDTTRDPLGSDGDRVYLGGGVTIRYAEQTTVLSLPALRRLRFPLSATDKSDPEVNLAAQTVIVALGLCSAALMTERGLDLRSRCLLTSVEKPQWELLPGNGNPPSKVDLNVKESIQLLDAAIEAAKKHKLPWREEPLILKPAKKLIELVRKSQELAVKSGVEEGA